MPKYKTKINYYNNGKLLTSSVITKPVQEITQAQIDVAMQIILNIHNSHPPYNCYATITQGKQCLKKFDYSEHYKFKIEGDDGYKFGEFVHKGGIS